MTSSEWLVFGSLGFDIVPLWEVVPFSGVSILAVDGSSFTASLLLCFAEVILPSRVVCDNLGFFAGLVVISDRALAFKPVESE